jgi:hypothetical protein
MPIDSRHTWLRGALFGVALAAAAACSSKNNKSSTTASYNETTTLPPYGMGESEGEPMAGEEDQTATAEQECPEGSSEITVRAMDTTDGVALVFSTTNPDEVEDLRKVVHGMSTVPQGQATGTPGAPAEPGSMDRPPGEPPPGAPGAAPGDSGTSAPPTSPDGTGAGAPGGAGATAGAGTGTGTIDVVGNVPVDATVIDTPDGAMIKLTPKDPNQLTALRDEVRRQATAMNASQCPREVSVR